MCILLSRLVSLNFLLHRVGGLSIKSYNSFPFNETWTINCYRFQRNIIVGLLGVVASFNNPN